MAMYQSPDRACIEFLKSSGTLGKGRAIRFAGKHELLAIPRQVCVCGLLLPG